MPWRLCGIIANLCEAIAKDYSMSGFVEESKLKSIEPVLDNHIGHTRFHYEFYCPPRPFTM